MFFNKKEDYKIIKKNVPRTISKEDAINIIESNDKLKIDFLKNYDKNVTFLSFLDDTMKVIEYNKRYYYLYEITRVDISWLEISRDGNSTHVTGVKDSKFFLDLLRCLIDCETGTYYYFPKNKDIKNIIK